MGKRGDRERSGWVRVRVKAVDWRPCESNAAKVCEHVEREKKVGHAR